jgi:hypothetical protein
METERSLPNLQAPLICLYPQPDQSSSSLPITLVEDTF